MQNCTLWICKTNMFNSLKILTGIDFMQKYNAIMLSRSGKLQRKSTKLTFPFQVYFTRYDYFHT